MDCTGSHGMSVGSLGQYKGETDIVENLYIYNITMANASDAARIKVWPGIETAFQTLLNGGGGLGRVKNVTYDLFKNINNDRAITITQCYGQKNQTLCEEHPVSSSSATPICQGREQLLIIFLPTGQPDYQRHYTEEYLRHDVGKAGSPSWNSGLQCT